MVENGYPYQHLTARKVGPNSAKFSVGLLWESLIGMLVDKYYLLKYL